MIPVVYVLILAISTVGGLISDAREQKCGNPEGKLGENVGRFEFQRNAYDFSIVEESPINTSIGQVEVHSSLNGDPPAYALTSAVHGFRVDNSTGTLYTSAILDRETQYVHVFNVEATRGHGGTVATARVTVHVMDINDNAPLFPMSTYFLLIDSDVDVGVSLFTFRATDRDVGNNGLVTYALSGSHEPFVIERSTGVLSIDVRTSSYNYTFAVVATDYGIPPRSTTANVSVIIRRNLMSYVTLNVGEGTSVNTKLHTVVVPDSNCTFYNISGSDSFRMDSTGQLFTKTFLDREQQEEYHILVYCNQDTSKSVNITVVVTDINDNAPHFHNDIFTFVLGEDRTSGEVGIASASDSDSGQNGEITYGLQPHGDMPFSIDAHTGRISIVSEPKQSLYILRATATDGGQPKLSSTCEVVIIIQRSLVFHITENLPTHTNIGSIFQPLPPGTGHVFKVWSSDPFELDSASGDLFTSAVLDREAQSGYFFHISFDGTTLAYVSVIVDDVNDNLPVFSQSRYDLTEHWTTPGLPVLQVQAMDADAGSTLSYSMATNSTAADSFDINAVTGVISIAQSLDKSNYTFSVEATDGLYMAEAQVNILVVNLNGVIVG